MSTGAPGKSGTPSPSPPFESERGQAKREERRPRLERRRDLGGPDVARRLDCWVRTRRDGGLHLVGNVDGKGTRLAGARTALADAGALGGESDHGNSLSLYGRDPDGNEFEVFWMLPREEWEQRGFGTRRLDLDGELARRGATQAQTA